VVLTKVNLLSNPDGKTIWQTAGDKDRNFLSYKLLEEVKKYIGHLMTALVYSLQKGFFALMRNHWAVP